MNMAKVFKKLMDEEVILVSEDKEIDTTNKKYQTMLAEKFPDSCSECGHHGNFMMIKKETSVGTLVEVMCPGCNKVTDITVYELW